MSPAPIKVVHVITRLDLGGAQRNTLHTVRSLDPERFAAVLVCGRGGVLDEELASWPQDGPRSLYVDDLVREVSPGHDLRAFLTLRRLFLEEKPAVVHTHSSKAGILGRLAARAAGVPVIVHTFHGFGFHEGQSRVKKWLYVLAERLAGSMSTALVFVSRDNQEYARRYGLGDPARYVLIRSGVRLSELPARCDATAKKQSLGLPPGSRLVLSVGNFKPQKNPADFLAAARIVARAQPEAAFAFVGDGPLRAEMEAGLGELGPRFLLPGWRHDVAELLAAADVFVLTSLWEGLPRALVEAMKSGVAAVCYATDGVKDVVRDGENGFLVAQGDVAALARRVEELLEDEAMRKRLGAAAAASIGLEFDIDAMVRRQEQLYLRLVGATGQLS
ncbi:MAG: glycosyltransferase family 4 protein [Elusimicrobia bacterium]|nr:glycosyltransferase family 4 protein [Elusimicrobiota bacterium]